MSIQIILILIALAGAAGIGICWFLRLIISLGKRGSMELQIRKMLLDAEVKAKGIIEEAEKRAKEKEEQQTGEFKERERDLKATEERLVRKEELLDKRQTNLEGEQESLARKNAEVQVAKESAEQLVHAQQEKLEKVANLSAEEAKKDLITSIEKQSESDIESRMRKLEISGN